MVCQNDIFSRWFFFCNRNVTKMFCFCFKLIKTYLLQQIDIFSCAGANGQLIPLGTGMINLVLPVVLVFFFFFFMWKGLKHDTIQMIACYLETFLRLINDFIIYLNGVKKEKIQRKTNWKPVVERTRQHLGLKKKYEKNDSSLNVLTFTWRKWSSYANHTKLHWFVYNSSSGEKTEVCNIIDVSITVSLMLLSFPVQTQHP